MGYSHLLMTFTGPLITTHTYNVQCTGVHTHHSYGFDKVALRGA